MNSYKLSVAEFEKLIECFLADLKRKKISDLELGSNDFYFSLIADDYFDIYQEQSKYTVAIGSLNDDILELKKLLIEDERPFTKVDLDRLSNILKIYGNV